MCSANGQKFENPFSVNANESKYSKIGESRNIYESGKISSSVKLVFICTVFGFVCAHQSVQVPARGDCKENSASHGLHGGRYINLFTLP